MPLCYRCGHANEPDRLKHCLKCSDADINRFPSKTVSLDAMLRPDGLVHRDRVKAAGDAKRESIPLLPPAIEMRLLDGLAGFMRLSFINQMLLIWILRGESLSDFGRMEWMPEVMRRDGSLSRQAVYNRLDTLKKAVPHLASAIERLAHLSKGSGRTRRKRMLAETRKRANKT